MQADTTSKAIFREIQATVARQAAVSRRPDLRELLHIPRLSDIPHCPLRLRRRRKKHEYESMEVQNKEPLEWTLTAEGRPEGQAGMKVADANVPPAVKRGFESQGHVPTETEMQPIIKNATRQVLRSLLLDVPFVAKATLLGLALFLYFFILWMWSEVSEEDIFNAVLLGAAVGFLVSFFIHYNRYRKNKFDRLANDLPGQTLVVEILGYLPSWLKHCKGKELNWLNKAIDQCWEHIDNAAGDVVRHTLEPLMEQYKVPIIKSINFKQFTFGTTPLVVRDAVVVDEGHDQVVIEMPFQLKAPTANVGIVLQIITLMPCGPPTPVMVKVRDLDIRGTARLELTNFSAELPCFGAIVFALRYPPIVRFKLDLGSEFGGTLAGRVIMEWFDPFLRDFIATMLVWPSRLVIPVHAEGPFNLLKYLHMTHRGVLQVSVIEAVGLRRRRSEKVPDPLIRCWLQPHVHEETTHKHRMTNPKWNERLAFLAQEPQSQFMRLEVYDWDGINLRGLLATPNVLMNVGQALGSKEFLARAPVPLQPAAEHPGRPFESWYELTRLEWSMADEPADNYGYVHLELRYLPFKMVYSKPRPSTKGAEEEGRFLCGAELNGIISDSSISGALLIKLCEAGNLPAADPHGLADVYVKFHMAGHTRKSSIKEDTLNPVWNESFEFSNVPKNRLLEVVVWDEDPFAPDDRLGLLEISVPEDVEPADNCCTEQIWFLAEVPPDLITGERKRAYIHLRVQWVPFDFPPDP